MSGTTPPGLVIGATADGREIAQLAAMMNRHGLVTGATGTGKTVSLQVLAEALSRIGVPVFSADIKGDLSGIADAGRLTPKLEERLDALGMQTPAFAGNPIALWDLFGRTGVPIRMTVSEMGPLLLARLLDLNDTQTGVLYATFKIADDDGLLLLDLADLRSMLAWVGEHAAELKLQYGNLSPTSIAAIQRSLLVLEEQGADVVFGEPALELADLIRTTADGRGVINLLDATKLAAESPQLYACFLFWLLSELFEELPERGDADQPLFVLFFDEAHLLFKGASKSLVDKIEQVVRLIRSKGVGVFFVTQSPLDIPEAVLGQLGLRIQHALRAFTLKDQRAVRVVAETFRAKEGLDTAQAITELATGEALVSTLDAKGQPTPVERTLIRPPASQIGPIAAERRQELLEASDLRERYATAVDRVSAHERLTQRAAAKSEKPAPAEARAGRNGDTRDDDAPRRPRAGYQRQTTGEALIKSVVRSVGSQIGSQLGRQVVRGLLGSLFGKSR
ncbi:MAG: helicase HerA-like domain-containing protein [Gammaproteobacteria bacterium]